MRRYVLARMLVALPSLLIASLVVFAPPADPGDVVSLMLEEKQYAKDLAELRAKLGLDRGASRPVRGVGRPGGPG